MKKSYIKKTSGILAAALIGVLPFINGPLQAKAEGEEQNCTSHTNYYFFTDIANDAIYEEKIKGKTRNHFGEFANVIPAGAKEVSSGEIELSRSGSSMTNSEWSLNNFWTNFKKAYYDGTGDYVYEDGDVTYLGHSTWSINGGETQTSGVSLEDISVSDLVKASVLPPNSINITFTTKENGGDKFLSGITRDYTGSVDMGTGVPILGEATSEYVMPALYYIEYEVCEGGTPGPEPTTKYKVTQYFKDNKTKQEIINSKVIGSDYEDGSSYSARCPVTIGDYELVSKEGHSGTIKGADVKIDCFYELTEGGDPGNVQTSDILIGVVWFIGIASLGYAAYYYNKYYRKNDDVE